VQIVKRQANANAGGRILAPGGFGWSLRPVSGGAGFPVSVRPDGDPGREVIVSDAGSLLMAKRFSELEILGAVGVWEVSILEDLREWRTSQARDIAPVSILFDVLWSNAEIPGGKYWGPSGADDAAPWAMPAGASSLSLYVSTETSFSSAGTVEDAEASDGNHDSARPPLRFPMVVSTTTPTTSALLFSPTGPYLAPLKQPGQSASGVVFASYPVRLLHPRFLLPSITSSSWVRAIVRAW